MKKVSWYDKIKSGANYTDYVKIYEDNVLKQEFKTSAVTCPDDRSVIIIQQENNLHKGFQKVALSFDDLEKLYKNALISEYGGDVA